MKFWSKIVLSIAALVLVSVTGSTAYADGIVFVSPDIQKLVPPLAALNLQHQGNNASESGGVSFTSSGDLAFGDLSAGPHQHTVSLTGLGVGRANDLRVLLNINEANGGDKAPITVDSLVLAAFDQAGNAVFSASLVEAAMTTDGNLRLGLSAALSNVNGGPERFRYSGAAGPVPEPTTMVLLGTGLAGLAGALRRRRKAAANKTDA